MSFICLIQTGRFPSPIFNEDKGVSCSWNTGNLVGRLGVYDNVVDGDKRLFNRLRLVFKLLSELVHLLQDPPARLLLLSNHVLDSVDLLLYLLVLCELVGGARSDQLSEFIQTPLEVLEVLRDIDVALLALLALALFSLGVFFHYGGTV